ncbi:MAG: MFS transporter [bacterium]|nr:MFS transporter [bacterium]
MTDGRIAGSKERPVTAALACSFSWMSVAFAFTAYMPAVSHIKREFAVGEAIATIGLWATLLMRPVGALVFGHLADTWSRRASLLLACSVITITGIATACAPNLVVLILARAMFGLGMGGVWPTGATLSLERVADGWRGVVSGALTASWAVGAFLGSALYSAELEWREVLAAASVFPLVPALLVWRAGPGVTSRRQPESAREPLRDRFDRALRDLSRAASRPTFFIVLAVTLSVFCGYYSLVSLRSATLESMGVSKDGSVGVSKEQAAFVRVLFDIGMAGGALVIGVLLRFLPPSTLIAVPSILFLPVIPFYVGVDPAWLPLASLLAGMLGIGCSGVLATMLAGTFPEPIRTRMTGICFNLGAVASAGLILGLAVVSEMPGVSAAWVQGVAVGVCQILMIASALLLLRPYAQRRKRTGVSAEEEAQGSYPPSAD